MQLVTDKEFKPNCRVKLNATAEQFDEFVVVAANPNGSTRMFQNADAYTLGRAVQLTNAAFHAALANMTPEQAEEVRNLLSEVRI